MEVFMSVVNVADLNKLERSSINLFVVKASRSQSISKLRLPGTK